MTAVRIGNRAVGSGLPAMLVAEIGVNHDGDPDRARVLIDRAADAGADAVKFQAFRPERLLARKVPGDAGPIPHPMWDLLDRLALSEDAWPGIFRHAVDRGVVPFATPFDAVSAGVIVEAGTVAIKMGSGEVTDLRLLRKVAGFGLPVILSTGMSTFEEIDRAVTTIREGGDPPRVLLHCTSAYPAPHEDLHLRSIPALRDRYAVPVGISDHSVGHVAVLGAVALGACMVEKHFTDDRDREGPDHAVSLDPEGFAAMVREVRGLEAALGSPEKRVLGIETPLREKARRGLYAAREIRCGARIADADVAALRPCLYLGADRIGEVVGRTAARTVPEGAPLKEEDLA